MGALSAKKPKAPKKVQINLPGKSTTPTTLTRVDTKSNFNNQNKVSTTSLNLKSQRSASKTVIVDPWEEKTVEDMDKLID